jgi:sugar transferase (PEP-CTERM/EpsH1 system associated)
MRILFVTPHVPSPLRSRPRQFLRHLTARGHQVTLVVLTRPGERRDALSEVGRWCRDMIVVPVSWVGAARSCLLSLPGSPPLNVAFFASAEARRALARLDRSRFDVAHLEHLRTAQYTPILHGLPRLYDAVDCMTLLWSRALHAARWRGRALAAWELWKTRRYERRALGWMDGAVATTEADAAALRGLEPALPVWAVPNGVDSDYFRPGPDLSDGRTLVFLGNMGYHANVASVLDFVRRAMPLVWERHPRCRLVIVGADPSAEVRSLERDHHITVTGYVRDVRPYLSRATVAVSPVLYGAGVQNKVLECMAAGLPVVASPQACSGLEARPGEHLLLAEDPPEWADAVCGLLDSPVMRRRLSAAGREYVVRCHSWQESVLRLEEAYEEVISRREQAIALGDGLKRVA